MIETSAQTPAKTVNNGSDYYRIERAIRFLDAHAQGQPSLEELAAHLGLSAYHCHRLFHRWAGITPKDFLQLVTLQSAKTLLRQSRSVLETALESGLSGPGRLHDLFLTIDAMTPGEYRQGGAGLTLRWGIHPTPAGDACIAITDRGICAIRFLDGAGEPGIAELQAEWPRSRLMRDQSATASAGREIAARMRGQAGERLSVLFRGTPFQLKVWQALLDIPEGAVASYSAVAARIGHPEAVRAAASAVGANAVAYLIPCHRVLRSTGAIGGYRWGEPRKRALLTLEQVRKAAGFAPGT